MNRLYRDCFFFAATATLLAGCWTPAVINEPTFSGAGTLIRKTIKADGRGGIVEDNQNLQLADPTRDGFTVIGRPQAKEIYGAIPQPLSSKRKVQSGHSILYHIKYNGIMAALSAEPPGVHSNAAPTNTTNVGYLRYRVWIPAAGSDNIGKWSPWSTSNGLDVDNASPSLSATPLKSGKWTLTATTSTSNPSQLEWVTIQATAADGTQYTWTGCWSPKTKNGDSDASGRGSITWHLGSSPCQ